MSIKVLVVDDHIIIRDGLRLIFDTTPDIDLIGEASNGVEGLQKVDELKPDVVLMDLQMPVMDGITAIEQLRKTHPGLAIIILTTYREKELIYRGLASGARGYLLKDTERETLLATILAAARGETLLQPDILQQAFSFQQNIDSAAPPTTNDVLTEREMEVLLMVADGARNKEIAYQLNITERTVKAHLSHIYQKLAVDSRAAAVAEGAKRGWL